MRSVLLVPYFGARHVAAYGAGKLERYVSAVSMPDTHVTQAYCYIKKAAFWQHLHGRVRAVACPLPCSVSTRIGGPDTEVGAF